ncbi:MAG TPA: universal stress protein [Burkholderiales bacterium]|nr:universal stress protein [Burkholderiales bacterium]
MPRILVAVDGSKPSERAVRHVVALHAEGLALSVLLLNVQPPWAPARSKEEEEEGKRLHAKAAERALRAARGLLDAARIRYEARMQVGDAAQTIARLARTSRCSHIVMGMRGRGAVARAVFGSVSLKTLQLAAVPVTLVK